MSKNSTRGLSSCPLCGCDDAALCGQNALTKNWGVKCDNYERGGCGLRIEHGTQATVVKTWNTLSAMLADAPTPGEG